MQAKNTLYPIFLKLEKIEVLIIGAGEIGLEKLTYMLKSSPEANITVIAKDFHYKVVELSHFYSNVNLIEKAYHHTDLEDIDLLIVATDDVELNTQIKRDSKDLNLLANVADNPELCDFYLGGIVTKGNVKMGISTNGQSPTLAKKLRMFFEEVIPDEVEYSAELLNEIRGKIKQDLHGKITTLNTVTSVLNEKTTYKENYQSKKFAEADFQIFLN